MKMKMQMSVFAEHNLGETCTCGQNATEYCWDCNQCSFIVYILAHLQKQLKDKSSLKFSES
jgi:hypothetical protein